MAVASTAWLPRANVEEEDDGAVVLLRPEVIQVVDRTVEPTVHGHQQNPLLEHACRSMQVGVTNSVCGQGQDTTEELELLRRSPDRRFRITWQCDATHCGINSTLLLPLLVTERFGDFPHPVIHCPCRYGSAHFVLAERVLAAHSGVKKALGEGKGVEVVRLFDRLHNGSIGTRAVPHNPQALDVLTEVHGQSWEPALREGATRGTLGKDIEQWLIVSRRVRAFRMNTRRGQWGRQRS
jgi:hypothetical protein